MRPSGGVFLRVRATGRPEPGPTGMTGRSTAPRCWSSSHCRLRCFEGTRPRASHSPRRFPAACRSLAVEPDQPHQVPSAASPARILWRKAAASAPTAGGGGRRGGAPMAGKGGRVPRGPPRDCRRAARPFAPTASGTNRPDTTADTVLARRQPQAMVACPQAAPPVAGIFRQFVRQMADPQPRVAALPRLAAQVTGPKLQHAETTLAVGVHRGPRVVQQQACRALGPWLSPTVDHPGVLARSGAPARTKSPKRPCQQDRTMHRRKQCVNLWGIGRAAGGDTHRHQIPGGAP